MHCIRFLSNIMVHGFKVYTLILFKVTLPLVHAQSVAEKPGFTAIIPKIFPFLFQIQCGWILLSNKTEDIIETDLTPVSLRVIWSRIWPRKTFPLMEKIISTCHIISSDTFRNVRHSCIQHTVCASAEEICCQGRSRYSNLQNWKVK